MQRTFLYALAERAVKTFCQALVALLGAGAVDILSVPWPSALATAAGAALVSVLTSIASSGFGNPLTPSLVDETPELEYDAHK